MARNKEIDLVFKAETASFNKSLSEVAQNVTRINKEYKLTSEQLRNTGSETDKLSNQLATLTAKHAEAQAKVEALSGKLEKARELYGDNSDEVRKLENQLIDAQTAEQKIANQIETTNGKLAEAKAKTSEYAQELNKLQSEEKQLETAAQQAGREFDLQKAQFASNATESQKLKSEVNALGQQYAIAQQQTANLEKQLDTAAKVYGENSAEVQALNGKLTEAKTAEAEFANRINETNKAIIEQGGALGDVGDKLQSAGQKIAGVGQTLTRSVTLPIIGIGTAAVAAAANFEAGMSEVEAISGATSDDMLMLEAVAKEMGATTKFSATEAAEGLKYMAMAGWDANAMAAALPGVMNLAASSGENLGTVSDIVTDAMTAFGLSADQAGHFADVLATAASASNTNVGMLGESFKYVAPVAGALGYSIEDTSFALGLLANNGIKGSQAGTALSAAFSEMLDKGQKNPQMLKDMNLELFDMEGNALPLRDVMGQLRDQFGGVSEAVNAAGIELTDANGEFKDGEQLMEEFAKAGGDVTQQQQLLGLQSLFGRRSLASMLSIVNTSTEDYEKLSGSIDNSSGAAKRMADTMQDNLLGRLTLLKSNLEGVGITAGNILIPHLEKLISKINDVVTWFGNLDSETQETILTLMAVAAAAGPVLTIFGKITSGFGSLISAGGSAIEFLAQLGIKFGITATSGAAAAGGVAATGAASAAATVPVMGFGAALSSALGVLGIVAGVVALAVGAYHLLTESQNETRESVKKYRAALSDSAETQEYVKDRIIEFATQQAEAVREKYSEMYNDVKDALYKIREATGTELPQASSDFAQGLAGYRESLKADIQAQTQDNIETVQRLYTDSNGVLTAEGEALIEKIKDSGERRELYQDQSELRISQIMQSHVDERGVLTEEGYQKILDIQRTMYEKAAVEGMNQANAQMMAAAMTFGGEFGEVTQETYDNFIAKLDETFESSVQSSKDILANEIIKVEAMKDASREEKDIMLANAKEEHDGRVKEASKTRDEAIGIAQQQLKGEVGVINQRNAERQKELDAIKKNYESGTISLFTYNQETNRIQSEMSWENQSTVKQIYDQMGTDRVGFGERMVTDLARYATKSVTGFSENFDELPKKAKTELTANEKNVSSSMTTVKQTMSSGGTDAGNNFGSTLNGSLSGWKKSLSNTANALAKTALDAANRALGIKSPSQEAIKMIDFVFKGFNISINKNAPEFNKMMAETAKDGIESFGAEADQIQTEIIGKLGDIESSNLNKYTQIPIYATVRSNEDIRLIARQVNNILGMEV